MRLAERSSTELAVLIVEDSNLLHLAELPLAAEIGWWSEVPRAFDVDDALRMLRAQTGEARRSLSSSPKATEFGAP